MSYESNGDTLKEIANELKSSKLVVGAEECTNNSSVIYFNSYREKNTASSSLKQETEYGRRKNRRSVDIEEEDANMDENKLLEKYMDKIDSDQRELKAEVREREERIEKRIAESERRIDLKLERIENMISEQNKKMDDVKDSVNQKMDENRRFMWGIVITIVLSIIASIGVIVSTYQSSISLIQQYIK